MCRQNVQCFHTVPLHSDRRHKRRSRTSQRVHEAIMALRSRGHERRWVKSAKKEARAVHIPSVLPVASDSAYHSQLILAMRQAAKHKKHKT